MNRHPAFRNPLRATKPTRYKDCCCGQCGLQIPRTARTRNRVWAAGCPQRKAHDNAEWMKRYEALKAKRLKAREEREAAKARREPVAPDIRVRNPRGFNGIDEHNGYHVSGGKFCSVCYDITDRRPRIGCCPECKGVYRAEVVEPPNGLQRSAHFSD